MANYTPNLNLVKPTNNEVYDIAVQNNNMDIIDANVLNNNSIKFGSTSFSVTSGYIDVSTGLSSIDYVFLTISGSNPQEAHTGYYKEGGLGAGIIRIYYVCSNTTTRTVNWMAIGTP